MFGLRRRIRPCTRTEVHEEVYHLHLEEVHYTGVWSQQPAAPATHKIERRPRLDLCDTRDSCRRGGACCGGNRPARAIGQEGDHATWPEPGGSAQQPRTRSLQPSPVG